MIFQRPVWKIVLNSFLFGILVFLLSCHLQQETQSEDAVSFDKLYDSLKVYDSVVVIFLDSNSLFLDTVYSGKVKSRSEISGLKVDGWDGGEVRIQIFGFMDSSLVYQVEKRFDGRTDRTDGIIVRVSPSASLNYLQGDIRLGVGDSIRIPEITVLPENLSDKNLAWESSNPSILQISLSHFIGKAPGPATATVRLRSDRKKKFEILVMVSAKTNVPLQVDIPKDTLYLVAGGASLKAPLDIIPSNSDKRVFWSIRDTTLATVSASGVISGRKKGSSTLTVNSEWNRELRDSAIVVVSDPVEVEKLSFDRNPRTLYVGGVSDSLSVSVFPPEANQSVEFTVLSEGVVSLTGKVLSPVATGFVQIVARSTHTPKVTDTLRITVLVGYTIDRVLIEPSAAKEVFVGGNPIQLVAKIEPAKSPQQIQWKSGESTKAGVDVAGRISGFSPGLVTIYAISAADSTKKDSIGIQVRRDMPQLIIGRDTTVPVGMDVLFNPEAKKISGKIECFKWDLDGNQKWDDSSESVQPVSRKYDSETPVLIRFYVRDNQGNDTVATKWVKPVSGPILLINSPLDNSYSRVSPVKVIWTINGSLQDSLPLEKLKSGLNEIARSTKDSAGQTHSVMVRVTYDTIPPKMPSVSCPRLVNTSNPGWSWLAKGEGAGVYRFALDGDSYSDVETKETVFSVALPLKEGIHFLFVQERDYAGNWSDPGKCSVTVDLTIPKPPEVGLSGVLITNSKRPRFIWHTGGGGGGYEYRIDAGEKLKGMIPASDSSLVSGTDLPHGAHTFFLKESDSAGNWSDEAKVAFTIDTIPPASPKVNGSAVTNTYPHWSWRTGGGNGQGLFRSKINNPELSSGAKEGSDTVFTLAAFENGMSYTLYVQEKDLAGNWSESGQFTIKVDTSGPSSPIVGSSVGTLTNNPTPKWTWSSGGGGIAYFQYSLDQSDISKGIETMNTELTIHLSNGPHTLRVREKDSVGNWSAIGSWVLVVDTIGPGQPSISLTQKSPSNIPRPTWKWNSGGSGKGLYRYKLDDADLSKGTTQGPATEFIPNFDLAEGKRTLYVQEQDSAGNWSSTGIGMILLDFTGPNKPIFDQAIPVSPVNSLRPTWTWASGGNGGSGAFRVKVNDSDMTSGATSIPFPSKSFTPVDFQIEGTFTLFAQEMDSAGNWSQVAKRALYCTKSGLVGPALSGTESYPLEIITTSTGVPFVNIGGSPNIVKYYEGGSWINSTAIPSGTGGGLLRKNPSSGMPSFFYQGGDGKFHLANYSAPFWGEPGSPFEYSYPSPSISFAYGKSSNSYVAVNSDTTLHTFKYTNAMWNQAFPDLGWKRNFTLTSIEMEFDSLANIPYVHFRCGWSDVNATMEIWRYINSKWEKVTSTGLPLSTPAADRIGVNKAGELHMVGMDFGNANPRMFVKKYSGTEWKPVGSTYVSDIAAGEGVYSLAFNSAGNPVIAFNENGFVAVYAFTGTAWKKMGTAGATRQFAQISLSVGPNDIAYVAHGGIPYVFKVGFDP